MAFARRLFCISALLLLLAFTITGYSQAATPAVIYAVGPQSIPIYEPEPEDENGWKGLFIEIAEMLFTEDLGYDLVVEQYPWKRAQQIIKDGLADVTITIPTPERLEYALKSKQPVFQMHLYVYTYADHPKLNEIRKIKTVRDIFALDLKAVANLGNGWFKENIEDAGVMASYVPDDEDLVQFLALKRADIMIDAPLFMNTLIKKLELESKIVRTEALFGPLNFHLLVSKKSRYADLMPQIDKSIETLAQDGRFEELASRYTVLYEGGGANAE